MPLEKVFGKRERERAEERVERERERDPKKRGRRERGVEMDEDSFHEYDPSVIYAFNQQFL